jgi:hypothetical protein
MELRQSKPGRSMTRTHKVDGLVIHTSHDRPPIPSLDFEWSAVTDDYDGAPDAGWQPVGHGRTEDEAIADLLRQIEEYQDGYDADEAADFRREERR